jgi:hypothetical protein
VEAHSTARNAKARVMEAFPGAINADPGVVEAHHEPFMLSLKLWRLTLEPLILSRD